MTEPTTKASRVLDSYHESECGIFIGTTANGRYVEKPCTCGLDAAIAEDRAEARQQERERIMGKVEKVNPEIVRNWLRAILGDDDGR